MDDIEKGIRDAANFMAIAARTAPKTRGKDNLLIKIFEKSELKNLAERMRETGKKTDRPQTFERDAECVLRSSCVLAVATTYAALGLNCGFCGYTDCNKAETAGATCAYNSADLGIAVSSAVLTAGNFHIDNRIMYTIGYTVTECALLGKEVRMALGIPLSVTGKNIFFDRK